MSTYGFVSLRSSLPYWPSDLLGQPQFLDEIGLRDFEVTEAPDLFGVHGTLLWFREISVPLPGLDAISLAFLSENGHTAVPFELDIQPNLALRLPNLTVAFRINSDFIRPVRKEGDRWVPLVDAAGRPRPAAIRVDGIGISADADGDFEVLMPAGAPQLSLGPVVIGETGIVLEVDRVRPFFSAKQTPPAGAPIGFRGVAIESVKFHLPSDWNIPLLPSDFTFERMLIGTSGFSGVIRGTWNPTYNASTKTYTGKGSGTLFGIPFGLRSVDLTFQQNVPTSSSLRGEMVLPFFEHPLAVEIGIGVDGGLTAVLSPAQPDGVEYETGLVTLEKPGLLRLKLESIAFQIKDGVFAIKLAGEVTPLVGTDQGLQWPSFRVDELSIDSKGKIRLEGGWLNLREKYHMNFHGFQLEISKLGFGNTEDGGKWIGFTGGVKLVAGMPAGASVEGLRITWYEDGREIEITLKGVRVDFEVPNALKFTGAVSYDSATKQFHGAIKLNLIALKMQVDAVAVFGIHEGQNYLAVYLAAQFPAGIPLFATGLGVYGMAGLFAINMEPNRQANQAWYEIGTEEDWYHKSPVGVTDLKKKWTPRIGSMAFGAGVTLGTVADNGHTFSAQMLLVIVFPGPILLLQGSASLLKERATLDTDATFRAIAVLDGRAGTLTVGLDAQYRFDNNGALIDIRGAAEGFFNFNDPNAWRLNVGLKDPRERRLTARLFQLFDANAYLMLNAHELAMGAWIGFKRQWQFGPLSVALEAWIEGNARVSWKPAHFYGDLWLHGSVRLAVFGFGVGLTVDARIAADVFDPFHVVGQFSVAIDLPWPFPDFSASIKLEWGPDPTPPPLPLPLKEVAIEHFKATTSWPLPRANPALLLPNYNDGDGFFKDPDGGSVPDWSNVPIVPLDCRPHVTFARNINDDALVGVNAQAIVPEWERIGDPVRKQGPVQIRYGLEEVALEKLNGNVWETVARKRRESDPSVPTLYGSWAPVPQMPGGGGRNAGQVKLWLWSRTPFNYTRHSSRAWDEWFTDEFSGYPCQTLPGTCWDFENIAPSSNLPTHWHHPDEPGLLISSFNNLSIVVPSRPAHGLTHALVLSLRHRGVINLPRATNLVRVMVSDRLIRINDFHGEEADRHGFVAFLKGSPDNPYIEIAGVDIVRVHYFTEESMGFTLARGVGGAIGCDYVPSRHQLLFVEFHGKLSMIELITGEYIVLGTGYNNPEDVSVTASGTVAYVTERSGTLLRVDLTGADLNRSAATVVSSDMTAPHQIALDEARGKAYVVEFGGEGRLLCIDLDGATPGRQTVIASGLQDAIGLLITPDAATAYVSEQGEDGRLSRISIDTGAREPVTEDIPGIFFLRWANAARNSILAAVRDPHNRLLQIHLTDSSVTVVSGDLPFRPSSVVVLPDDRYVVCSDNELTILPLALHISKICDVGNDVLVRHFEEELTRWSQTGEVLEPYTKYRLKIVTNIRARGERELRHYSDQKTATEFAYFRTDGPPGVAQLTPPIGSEAIETFTTPLDDLTRYVQRTMPRVVEPTPDTPVPSRPFYRAYDIGIEFDENYVDLMYRLGRRDLTIHLYDGNGAIRDDRGGRVVLANQWGRAEEVTLTDSEQHWLSVLDSSGCSLVNLGSFVKNTTFNAATETHLLPPLTLCEARLVPALLHEDFAGYATNAGASGANGKFERWQVQDDSGSETSRWEIREEGTPPDFVLVQTTNATTTLFYTDIQNDPDPPSNWTDYRLTVHLRSSDGRIGVVFRYQNDGQHYRFVMDRQAGKRELIHITGGVPPPVLASDSFSYTPNQTYVISVEAVKSSLRVYQDDALIFAVTDAAISAGSVGLHCAGNSSARFTDIFVDDYRTSAPIVYRFNFLSSRFRNFSDHLGSFENKTWRVELDPMANVAPLIGAAVLTSDPVSDAESRAFDALFMLLPGVATAAASPLVRATRVERSGEAIAFLIQSPEPLDWTRIALQVLRAELQTSAHGPVDARVLRKADGAALLIVVPASNSAGSLLMPGEYRLNFTYRRDNRANDSQSELLSEAGNTASEQATLDIPWQTQG